MSATRTLDVPAMDERTYLAWEADTDGKFELVDGQPRAMTGGTRAHDRIGANLRAELWSHLKAGDCLPYGPDLKVKAGKNYRYPDALVDCGPRDARDTVVEGPIAVFEVLSSSTAWIDQSLKMRDYDANPAIRIYGLFLQDEIRGLVYRRDAAGHLSPGKPDHPGGTNDDARSARVRHFNPDDLDLRPLHGLGRALDHRDVPVVAWNSAPARETGVGSQTARRLVPVSR